MAKSKRWLRNYRAELVERMKSLNVLTDRPDVVERRAHLHAELERVDGLLVERDEYMARLEAMSQPTPEQIADGWVTVPGSKRARFAVVGPQD